MKTVLIIDDDKDIRDVLSVALTTEGWMVQVTDSLLGALNALTNHDVVDYMLLDYNLPGMAMEDFLSQVQALSPKMEIILISATDTLSEKAKKYNIAKFLKKPIDFDTLRTLMTSDANSADSVGPSAK